MARYRLTDKHYLNCPGTEWEQVEIGPTGKQFRHRYNVHRYIDPEDPSTFDENPEGAIITTKSDPRYPRDILFVGAPSQAMVPLDEEAERQLGGMTFGVNPMSEEAFPTQVAPAAPQASREFAELRAMLAELTGAVTLLRGENEELKRRIVDEEDQPSVGVPLPKLDVASIRLGG